MEGYVTSCPMNRQWELIQGEGRGCVQTQRHEETWHIYNLELRKKDLNWQDIFRRYHHIGSDGIQDGMRDES